ncbi:MAG: serine protease [Patescibacteria group bacterium]
MLTKQNMLILASVCAFLLLVSIALGYGVISLYRAQRALSQNISDRFGALSEEIAGVAGDTDILRTVFEEMGESAALRDAEAKKLADELGALSENLTTLKDDSNIAGLVASWSPYVYVVECQFEDAEGVDRTGRGSATLIREETGVRMMTNKHVVTEEVIRAEECLLKRFDNDTEYEIDGDDIVLEEGKDIAEAPVPEATLGVLPWKVCTERPVIGDSVVILGYPGIGSKESITATEGIISGIDTDHYITSAKIERGNSGGAAIDVKNDCFLGIPTLVYTGRVESLARILPLQ